jgi:inorganic phosphate transporter, PiT family
LASQIGNALVHGRSLIEGVHWSQVWKVLEALAISPVLGFVLSAVIYFVLRRTVRDKRIYEPAEDHPPVWWMRHDLITTCTGVSFAHGTNGRSEKRRPDYADDHWTLSGD